MIRIRTLKTTCRVSAREPKPPEAVFQSTAWASMSCSVNQRFRVSMTGFTWLSSCSFRSRKFQAPLSTDAE